MTFKIELTTQAAKDNVADLNREIDKVVTKAEAASRALESVGGSNPENFGRIAKAAKRTGDQAQALKAAANQFQRISSWLQKSATNAGLLSTNLQTMSQTISRNLIVYKAYTSGLSGSVNLMTQLREQIKATDQMMHSHASTISKTSVKYQGLNKVLGTATRRYNTLAEAQKRIKTGDVAALGDLLAKLGTKSTKGSEGLKGFTKSASNADQQSAALRASLNALGTHMGIFTGRTIVTASVFYATVTALQTMITASTAFEKEMLRANAVMGASAHESRQLEDRVRSLARTTIFTQGQIAEGLTYLGMAGLNTQEALEALEPSLNIAKIGMISFQESADIVTNVLRAFRLEANELSGVADDLATAITNSNATIQQLAKSLSYVGPIAAAGGASLKEVVSILGTMHDVGIKSSRAGTALRRAYTNLLAPSTKVKNVFTKFGVTLTDGSGRMRSLTNIMYDFGQAGATAADMAQIFGVRAAAAMTAVLDDVKSLNPKLAELQEKLDGNKDAAKSLGEQFEDYLGADALKLISAIHDKMQDVFDVNHESFREIIEELRQFVLSINAENVGKFISAIAEFVKMAADNAKIIAFVGVLTVTSTILKTISYLFVSAGKALGFFLGSVGSSIIEIALATKGTNALAKAIGFLSNAFGMFGGPWLKLLAWTGGIVATFWGVSKAFETQTAVVEEATEAQRALNEELDQTVKLKTQEGNVMLLFSKESENNAKDRTLGRETTTIEQAQKKLKSQIDKYKGELTQYRQDIASLEAQKKKLQYAQFEEEMFPREILPLEKVVTERVDYSKNPQRPQVVEDISWHDPNPPETFTPITDETRDKWMKAADEKIKLFSEKRHVWGAEIARMETLLEDSKRLNLAPEDFDKGRLLQDKLDSYSDEKNLDDALKNAQKFIEQQSKEVEFLKDIGTYDPLTAIQNINAIRDEAVGGVQVLYEQKKAELDALETKYKTQLKMDEDGKLNFVGYTSDNREVYKPPTFDGADELLETYKQVSELEQKMTEFRDSIRGIAQEDMRNFIKDLFKDAKFDRAAEDLAKFNNKLRQQQGIIGENIYTLMTGVETKNKYADATEDATYKTALNAIAEQRHAIAVVEAADARSKALPAMRKKLELLIAEAKDTEHLIAQMRKLREEEDRAKKARERIDELNQMNFMPDEIKARYDYQKDATDMQAFYMMKYDLEQDELQNHAEYLEARKLLDMEYWESQHEGWNEFFESLGDNMSNALGQLLIYKESWADVREVIAIGVSQSAIKAIVDMGAEFIKFSIMKMTQKKADMALEQQASLQKQANTVAEAATEVSANAATTSAQAAASAEADMTISKLLGAGAAMLAEWLPAATAVNVATFGAAALAATGTMAIAQAGATAGAVGSSYAAGAGAAAVSGREKGGPMFANTPYLVGEAGPELVIPKVNSMVVANKDLKNADSPFNKARTPSEDSEGGDVRIVNAIDPDFIEDYLSSDEGEKVILNVVRKNKGNFD